MFHTKYSGRVIYSCIALVWLCFSVSASASGIYVLTGDDGSISLTNVPVDNRFKVLMNDEHVSSGFSSRSERQTGTRDPSALSLQSESRKGTRDLSGKARFDQLVEQTAQTYGLESALLHAVISVESGYNPSAVSSKGARGLMQLMPGTASRYGVANVLDPEQNVQGGARYLRDLHKLFNSDLKLVLAAYNAGENAVAKYGNQIPPYRETAGYVPRVMSYYQRYQTSGETPKAF